MYDPVIGRWLSQDPLGIMPAHYDLYRDEELDRPNPPLAEGEYTYDTQEYYDQDQASNCSTDMGDSGLARYVNYSPVGADDMTGYIASGWNSPLESDHSGVDYTNLYRYVFNSPTNASDPSGLEIRLYSSPVSSGQGHITILWFDPVNKIGIEYDGGGPASPQGIKKIRIPAEGVLDFKNQDPDNAFGAEPVMIVQTGKTAQEERDALEKAFQETDEISYYSNFPGPNSNTYAAAMLRNAGFPVSDVPGARGWNFPSRGFWGYGGLYYSKYGKPTTEAEKDEWRAEQARNAPKWTPQEIKIMNSRHFK